MSAMARRRLSSLKGLEKFQAALLADGMPDMIRWLRSKKKAKLLMDEVHKEIFELGPPTPPAREGARLGLSKGSRCESHNHEYDCGRLFNS